MSEVGAGSVGGGPRRCLWFTKGLGRGGVERLLVDLYPLIDRDRFEVEVAYVLPGKDAYHAELVDRGARVWCLGSAAPADPRWVAGLARLLAVGSFDVVHTHAPVPAVAARLVARGRSRPALVHTEHNMWGRYRRPTRMANAVTYHRNDAVVAVSDCVAATIEPPRWRPGPGVRTVHHGTVLSSVRGYGVEERRQRREALGLPTVGAVIGTVGNFTAKKDQVTLLRALAARSGGPLAGAHLGLIGSGPLEAVLRAEVDRLGLSGRVTFLGSRDDVFEVLPLFDVFCLSSVFEGFPIALVEAMASGLPVVATAVGGIPEIVGDGDSGRLVGARDPEGLAAALAEVLGDADLAGRLGGRAAEVAEGLDLGVAAACLQDVYDEALVGSRSR